MDMNEVEQLAQLIDDILCNSSNNELRKQKEELFYKIRDNNADKFTMYLLNLLKCNIFLPLCFILISLI